MAVFLVCEDALDGRVLDQLIVQPRSLVVLVAYGHGSRSFGAIRRYIEARTAGDVAVSVRDRDYDHTLAQANATWVNATGRQFTWRRHEIENYLLEPRAILELFDEWRALPSAPWASSLPATEADVDTLLQTLAAPLIPAHVAGLVRTEIFSATNALGSLGFTHPRVPAAPGPAGWCAAVVGEAARLTAAGGALAALPELQSAAIATRYNALFAQCGAGPFFAAREYLRDMGGKELLEALAQHLRGLGAPGRLNSAAIADQLLTALGRVYQANALFQPDDFAELATILAQY